MKHPCGTMILMTAILLFGTFWPAFGQNGRALSAPAPPVAVPRLEAAATIDGVLAEPVWAQAATLTGFYQFMPVDDRPAVDSTHVLVWYAPTGLYFGVRAFETHAQVRATLAERDKIDADDCVEIILDTYDDQRQAFVFGVNPLGVQSDGVLKDAVRSTGVIVRSYENLPYRIDLTPDFVYASKGRLTDFGYEVEVFIPFKSLRYQTKDVQDWGFNVLRRVQHSGYALAWSKIRQDQASFLSQSGRLAGLTGLRRGLVLEVAPEVTWSVDRTLGVAPGRFRADNPEPGGNLRWGITNNLTLNATANPDFSQVESDVVKIAFDPRSSVFFPEKRPFFLDGIELFETPQRLIYTRRLTRPVGAVKMTGKVSGTNVGLLSGADRRSTSRTGEDFRFINALRVSRDLRGQSTLGLVYTDKIDGAHTNRVAAVDGRLVFAEQYAVTFQGAGSFTGEGDGTGTTFAPSWWLYASRSGRRYGLNARFYGVHPGFNAEAGFIRRTNVAGASLSPQVTFYGREGASIEQFTASANLISRWTYDDFTAGRGMQDWQLFFTGRFGLRGGWSVSSSLLVERFGYPAELYANYFIERRDAAGAVVDTVAFTGTPALHDLSYAFNLVTPRFRTFSGGFYFFYGRDVNWWEWAGIDLLNVEFDLNWTPTEHLRAELRYNHLQYIRPGDRSDVEIRRIPRLKVEYQVTRSVFVRVVGQYDARAIDALRDNSRTEDPILLRTDEGALVRTEKVRTNAIRFDGLFAYRPTPGTVLFLGYGSSLGEPHSFRFQDLERQADGFFFKLSYLFRM